jgi:hypothetical protein
VLSLHGGYDYGTLTAAALAAGLGLGPGPGPGLRGARCGTKRAETSQPASF